ncbi:MAG: GNAT family N-acetyltransferase [Clostridia bacterium]|nr:GNAT family N-acetyltransferase [Clostridia bacterium]MBQ9848964.1 GNAT family N-acetyltransferase [Clostridia bacterium]
MPDMLVKLYELPDSSALYKKLESQGIKIIRPMTPNKTKVVEWVREHFHDGWADEISAAFTKFPVSCFIAYDENEKKILGFAGYDCTYRDFFGPTGVDESQRGKGIGGALFMRCMEAMRDEGYGYAVIGSAGPVDFYNKVCGATVIEGSIPGIYKDLI